MNIAGVSAWGTVDQLTHDHWKSMIDINLMGPIHVIEAFVPPMVEARRGGHLVNVSSAAGLVALPWHAAYSASKYGLRGLSEVLRFDLARHRIGVSVVVPGAVKTPLVQTVQIAGVDREHPSVQKWTDRFAGPRGLAGTRRRPNPARRRQEPVPHLHLARHPRAVHVQARDVVALQRRDAAGQRGVHPRTPAGPEMIATVRQRLMPSASVIVKNRSVWSVRPTTLAARGPYAAIRTCVPVCVWSSTLTSSDVP